MITTTGRYLSGDAFDEETGKVMIVCCRSPLEGVDHCARSSVSTVDLDVLVKVVGTGKPLGTHLKIILIRPFQKTILIVLINAVMEEN